MISSGQATFPKSRFTSYLVRENNLEREGFAAWIFYPGMIFGTYESWWGEKRKRTLPHEGIDLCFYQDAAGKISSLVEGTRVPVMYDGTVKKIIEDFLGHSIIVEHRMPGSSKSAFLTIYGHTIPEQGLKAGRRVREGEVLATMAARPGSKTAPLPHLHLTCVRGLTSVACEDLDWAAIGDRDKVELCDPLRMFDGRAIVLDHNDHFVTP